MVGLKFVADFGSITPSPLSHGVLRRGGFPYWSNYSASIKILTQWAQLLLPWAKPLFELHLLYGLVWRLWGRPLGGAVCLILPITVTPFLIFPIIPKPPRISTLPHLRLLFFFILPIIQFYLIEIGCIQIDAIFCL